MYFFFCNRDPRVFPVHIYQTAFFTSEPGSNPDSYVGPSARSAVEVTTVTLCATTLSHPSVLCNVRLFVGWTAYRFSRGPSSKAKRMPTARCSTTSSSVRVRSNLGSYAQIVIGTLPLEKGVLERTYFFTRFYCPRAVMYASETEHDFHLCL